MNEMVPGAIQVMQGLPFETVNVAHFSFTKASHATQEGPHAVGGHLTAAARHLHETDLLLERTDAGLRKYLAALGCGYAVEYLRHVPDNAPEWELLQGEDVAVTPGADAHDPAAEAKRTKCSIDCWRLIRTGGDASYEAFTSLQDPAVRLSRDAFDELHSEAQGFAPDDETAAAVEYIMLYHDILKSGRAYVRMGLDPQQVDHDEALRMLLGDPQYADARRALLPGANLLTPRQWRIVRDTLTIPFNYPQALQGEAPSSEEHAIGDDVDPVVRDAFIFHAVLDIAGALGDRMPGGSATITSPTFRAMKNLNSALRDPDLSSASERNEAFLDAELAHFTGRQAPAEPAERARMHTLARYARHMRLETPAQFSAMEADFNSLSSAAQAILETELNRSDTTRATLAYYAPALMKALTAKHGSQYAMMYYAHILQEAHIADHKARRAGATGILTVQLGDLVRSIRKGEFDARESTIRFDTEGNNLLPSIQKPRLENLDQVPEYQGGESLRGKRVIFVGEGGGSDGIQAAMLAGLFEARYGCTPVAVASVRSDNPSQKEKKTLAHTGANIGQATKQVTGDTEAVGGWRFLEKIPVENGQTTPMYVVLSSDSAIVQNDIEALVAATGADIVVGVDTGGDSLFRTVHPHFSAHLETDITPDQDYEVIQGLREVAKASERKGRPLTVLSAIVAPGVDSPSYAHEVLAEADAEKVTFTPDEIDRISATYADWRMDGTGSEEGRYGKTPLAWLHALHGRTGVQPLDLPRRNVTSVNNPWRAFTIITPAMAGVVMMDLEKHAEAISRTHES